ncbi:uncharacterized protein BX663DRAFT_554925 [Cokeromyces recurvatus]|uniref:uncharacterized protein n=1 Tax=Cokeromyces recurvatus TaxID=90255 RepID=UPI00221F1F6B|nr:uncharacterized protein BX663DRAFT_554925 [Cokeromyces recurvatus]KAI7899519.1 hypothetical protein BX663DRAFT_554925 [Cokeromyces recurvatus]
MNVAAKDSMADNELEETEDNLVNLILEKGRLLASSNKVEGCLVPEAAKKANIPRITAYRTRNEFNESGDVGCNGYKEGMKKILCCDGQHKDP